MGQPLQQLVEQTLVGMGYELVELEFAGAGLLRLFIDRPWVAASEQVDSLITIEDCELVSRQLTRLFEVEAVNYQRLEVSSPGLDRLLSRQADFERFAGQQVLVKLRVALSGRKNFEGVLVQEQVQEGPDAEGKPLFGIEYDDTRTGQSLKMSFTLADVDKARLVPQVDFKKQRVKNEGIKQ